MGIPTSAGFVHDDGTYHVTNDVRAAFDHVNRGTSELYYDYAAAMLPVLPAGTFDMWRYHALLPLETDVIDYPLAVGGTPLIASTRLCQLTGLSNLWLKDETRGPTGSNKDRATALVLQQAVATGVGTVTCASTGNVAVSLAVGAAAVGKRAIIFVPSTVSDFKLQLMLATGGLVIRVKEGYEAAFQLSRRAAKAFGWLDRNTGVNPLTLDAKKTVAFEIWEQLNRTVPDVIVAPVGDGVTLCGVAKGFFELVACGLESKIPRMVGVQAEGCQPLKRAWETNQPLRREVAETVADGIAVGAPTSAGMVLRDIKRCGGGFVAVADGEMLDAVKTLARVAGVLVEPAGAAAFAGLRSSLETKLIDSRESVVVLVTGSLLKTPQFVHPTHGPLDVHASLDDVARLLHKEGLNL